MKTVYVVLAIAALIVLAGITGLYLVSKPYVDRYRYAMLEAEANSDYYAGNYQAAIEVYGRMIALKPDKCDGYQWRGVAYNQSGQYGLAIRDESQALALLATPAGIDEIGNGDLTPEKKQGRVPEIKAELFYNRGLSYQDRGDNKSAVADFDSVLAIAPQNTYAYWGRAVSYDAMKQYPQALQNCASFIRFAPGDWNAYHVRSLILRHMGRTAEAIADSKQVIRLKPTDNQQYADLSELQEKIHDYTGAVATWRLGVERNPGDQDFLGGYGWEQYIAGDLKDAIATDQRALSLKPADWIEGNLGLCYAIQGNWPDASMEYQLVKAHRDGQTIKACLGDIITARKKYPNSKLLVKAQALLGA